MTDEFDALLKTDPLLLAEQITGASYKEDEVTLKLGMGLLMAKSQAVQDEMLLRDDTYRSNPLEDSIRIIEDLGFEAIYSRIYTKWEYGSQPVTYVIYWRAGVLLTVESYFGGEERGYTTNSIQFYGNWLPNTETDRWKYTSSGHFARKGPGYDSYDTPEEEAADPWVWVGHWPGSEGLRNTLEKLDKNGVWLEDWIADPWLWLHCYGEGKLPEQEDYIGHRLDETTAEKVAEFPPAIRDMITRVKAEDREAKELRKRSAK